MHRIFRRPALLSAVAVALVAIGISVPTLALGQGGGTAQAAKAKKKGKVRLLRGTRGPKGDKGSKGDKGDKGDKGTNGTNGATSVVVRQGNPVLNVPNGGTATATASCNAGERATGGGNSISGSTGWAVIESFPTPGTSGATPTGWRVDATNNTGSANNLVAIVICAAP